MRKRALKSRQYQSGQYIRVTSRDMARNRCNSQFSYSRHSELKNFLLVEERQEEMTSPPNQLTSLATRTKYSHEDEEVVLAVSQKKLAQQSERERFEKLQKVNEKLLRLIRNEEMELFTSQAIHKKLAQNHQALEDIRGRMRS